MKWERCSGLVIMDLSHHQVTCSKALFLTAAIRLFIFLLLSKEICRVQVHADADAVTTLSAGENKGRFYLKAQINNQLNYNSGTME